MFNKKKEAKRTYDKETEKPVLRCSICTGEQVFGFKNLTTGKLTEVSLIRNEDELKKFLGLYGLAPDDVEKVY